MVKEAFHKEMKIAYVYSSFATTGGTERMIMEKVNYFAERIGYDVTIITCFQSKTEQNSFYTSGKVKQINLEIPFFSQYKYKYPKRFWVKWRINRQLEKIISQTVNQVDPDILIGASRFRANFISSIKCRAIKIIECHVVRYNTPFEAAFNRPFPIRVFMKIYKFFYLRAIERNADVIVTLTEKDRLLWKRAKRTEVITNFSTMPVSQYSDCSSKRVVAIGRLVWEKGFGRLIEIWKIVSSRHTDWHLEIFGEGDMYDTIKTLINIYKARNVTIHGFTSNISNVYATSSICVVTSYYEGFSLVLLEAIKHGVPCVAFDCPFGPRSIINDAHCGFLVENDDIRIFSDRLCRLIEDFELRKRFSKECIERAKQFDVERIMNQWKILFEDLCKELNNS